MLGAAIQGVYTVEQPHKPILPQRLGGDAMAAQVQFRRTSDGFRGAALRGLLSRANLG
jgi:hypothetical protein